MQLLYTKKLLSKLTVMNRLALCRCGGFGDGVAGLASAAGGGGSGAAPC